MASEPTHPTTTRRVTRSMTGTVTQQYSNSFMARAHRLFVSALVSLGYKLADNGTTEPDLSTLIAAASISHDEHVRRNPKWSKAKCGLDK